MPMLYFQAGETVTSNITTDNTVIVRLPSVLEPAFVASPISQVTPYVGKSLFGYNMIIQLGNAKNIASALAPKLYSEAVAQIEEQKQVDDMDLELAVEEATAMRTNMAVRARPFLEYALKRGHITYPEMRELEQYLEEDHESVDVDRAFNPVFNALTKRKPHLKREYGRNVMEYIRSSIIDHETTEALDRIDPMFAHIWEVHRRARQQISEEDYPNPTQREATQYVLGIVRSIKADVPFDHQFYGVDVLPVLEDLIGVVPTQSFVLPVNEVVRGKNERGYLMPYVYDKHVPSGIEDIFVDPHRLTQIVAVLDRSLTEIVGKYYDNNPDMNNVLPQNEGFDLGLLVRALMPDNPTMRKLYPDERVYLPDMPEAADELVRIIIDARLTGKIARKLAPDLGLTEDEATLGLNKIISVLNDIMPLLPYSVYDYSWTSLNSAKVRQRHEALVEEVKMFDEQGRYQEAQKAVKLIRMIERNFDGLLKKKQTLSSKLGQEYGIETFTVFDTESSVIEDAINLFGEELNILRQVAPSEYFES